MSALKVVFCLTLVCLFAAIAVAVPSTGCTTSTGVISRTLAYAILTGVLAGVYAGLVLLATQVFGVHAPVAVAAATSGPRRPCPAPVQRQVQRRVDRRLQLGPV